MVIMCGVSSDNTITGAVCLSSNETLGKEKEYGKSFIGKDADGVKATDTIGGATMTTSAYKGAIQDAINAVLATMTTDDFTSMMNDAIAVQPLSE
jgi:hypothetical protein